MAHYVAIIDGKSQVTASDLSHIAVDFLTPGVLLSSYYQVTQQSTPDMTVKVATGTAYVFNSAYSMAYHTVLDSVANVTITSNASGNPRIDAIVIKIDTAVSPNSTGSNVATLVAVPGTPAASPVAPTDSAIQTSVGAGNAFLRLANVTVANGATSITTANIADARTLVSSKFNSDGWNSAGETWTYASADSPSFAFTVSGDVSTKYSAGMRVKLTQTTVKYFIITRVVHSGGTTTITVYGGTDYTLTNATITSPYYSTHKAPAGFPIDPNKWTVEVTDTGNRSVSSPAKSTWYNTNAALQISVPIGCWNVEYHARSGCQATGATYAYSRTTLSTGASSESDTDLTAITGVDSPSGTIQGYTAQYRRKTLSLTSKTLYYLNVWGEASVASLSYLAINGSDSKTIIRAICAYL